MLYPVNIELGLNIENYSQILDIFPNWKQFKRDIKITSLLDNKKIQFDVDINSGTNRIFGTLDEDDINLNSAAFVVKEMSFIINGLNVEKLNIKIIILSNSYGKVLQSFIDSNLEFDIHQSIKNGHVNGFYVNMSQIKQVA